MDVVTEDRALRVGKWLIEPMLNRISCIEETVRIEPQNMKLLLWLAAHPGKVVSLSEIEDAVWRELVVTPNSIYQSVAQLRRALGDDKRHAIYIETVPRKGYRLVAPVYFEPEPPAATASPSPPAELAQADRGARQLMHLMYVALAAFCIIALSAAVHFRPAGKGRSTASEAETGVIAQLVQELSVRTGNQISRTHLLALLGESALILGHNEQARIRFEEALALRAQASGNTDPMTARILDGLANVELWNSNYAAAEARAREALQILSRDTSAMHPEVIRVHDTLASILLATGRYAEAGIHANRAWEMARRVYGETHIRTIGPENSLTMLHMAQGHFDEAEAGARRVLKKFIDSYGIDEVEGAFYRICLAMALYKKANYAEAVTQAEDSLETLARVAPPDHPYVASAQHILGESLAKLGKFAAAERALLMELRMLKENGAESWRIARACSALSEALLGQHRILEARAQLAFASSELDGVNGWLETEARLATEERMRRLQHAIPERGLKPAAGWIAASRDGGEGPQLGAIHDCGSETRIPSGTPRT